MTSLATDEPDFAMGQVLAAYLSLTSTDVPDLAGAREIAAHLDTLALNERESRPPRRRSRPGWRATGTAPPAASTPCWSGGPPTCSACSSATSSTSSSATPPTCATGSAARCPPSTRRTRTTATCAGCTPSGSRRAGTTSWPSTTGSPRVDRNPDDVWATHAVTHVYEMQGRIDEGIRFLRGRQADWGAGQPLHGPQLVAPRPVPARGRSQRRVARHLRPARPQRAVGAACPLEMLDASALLWRLHLDGVDAGGRFAPLADAWATRTADEPWYVFNDLHAVMALAGAGRLAEARAVDRPARRLRGAPRRRPRTSA